MFILFRSMIVIAILALAGICFLRNDMIHIVVLFFAISSGVAALSKIMLKNRAIGELFYFSIIGCALLLALTSIIITSEEMALVRPYILFFSAANLLLGVSLFYLQRLKKIKHSL